MIPLTTLYDVYIDQPKFTEQINPFDYIFLPPHQSGVRNKKVYFISSFLWHTMVGYQFKSNLFIEQFLAKLKKNLSKMTKKCE